MNRTGGRPRKVIWISFLAAAATLGVLTGWIVLSTPSGRSDASTDDSVPHENGTGETAPEGSEERGEASGKEEEEPVPVEISRVGSGSISSYFSTTANLEAENEARVLAEIEGLVEEVLVEEGDPVRKGDLLARLDEGDRAIRLRKAALKLENDRRNFERAKRMSASDLISEEDFQKLEYSLHVSRQELEEAEYELSRTEIRSPLGGVVSERIIKTGTRVKPADHLFSLVGTEPLIAKIFLPEKDVLEIDDGDEVLLALNAVEGARFPGRVSRISPIVDPGTGTVKVTIEVPEAPGNVRPGSFVTVHIVRETHDSAVTVPGKAIVRELQENFVFVVEGEEARKRVVDLGFEENGYVEILSGLKSGERIVTVGQGGLEDGARVRIVDA